MSYIAVIGAGSWGTTLASLLAERNYDVTLWAFEREIVEDIGGKGINSIYLPGVMLPAGLKATGDLEKAIEKARYILNVVPTQFTRSVFSRAAKFIRNDAVLISASKGIEQGSLMTVSAILKELTNRQVAVLSGPSFAKEVVKKLPTAVTLATEDPAKGLMLQEIFNTNYFRVYTHNDVLGVELGGALKNVIAIASGISDGLGLGQSARAALITRGLAEMMRLGEVLGTDPRTFSGLSGLGDLVLTCTGSLSRNYSLGVNLGKKRKLDELISSTKSIAEGVATSQSAFELSLKHRIEMPIVERVYNVLYKNEDPAVAVQVLMNRALKSEF